jgi:hypothetical protein
MDARLKDIIFGMAMGVFYDHYVEYRIVHRNGMHMVLITKDEANKRLLSSKYYNDRKSTWFSEPCPFDRGPIPDVDIALTDAEESELQSGLLVVAPVAEHGWYEVNDVMTTHG